MNRVPQKLSVLCLSLATLGGLFATEPLGRPAASGMVAQPSDTLRFRGMLFSNGSPQFALTDGAGNGSGWISLGGTALGYTLVGFDSEKGLLTLVAAPGSEKITLRLDENRVVHSSGATPPVSAILPVLRDKNLGAASLASPPNSPPLPRAVRAQMFPPPGAARPPVLQHPREAAPSAEVECSLPPSVARFFPDTPGPKWENAIGPGTIAPSPQNPR